MPAAEHVQFGPPEGRGAQRRWRLVGVAALAVVVVTAVALNLPGESVGLSPPPVSAPSPTASSRSSRPTLPTRPPVTPDTRPRVVSDGGPLLDGQDSWLLYAVSATKVYRIDVGSGRVVATDLNLGFEVGEVLAVRGGVIARSGEGLGVLVPDGRPAQNLTEPLSRPGRLLPASRGRVWFVADSNGTVPAVATLVNPDGVPSRVRHRATSGYFLDGAGSLLLADVGGVWEMTGDGWRRVTRGGLLAAGPSHFLVRDCDAGHRCRSSLVSRRSGSARRLGSLGDSGAFAGVVSSDGRYAVLATYRSEIEALTLWDLAGDRPVSSRIGTRAGQPGSRGQAVFSPDSRWVASLDNGRVILVETWTGRTVTPNLPAESLVHMVGAAAP